MIDRDEIQDRRDEDPEEVSQSIQHDIAQRVTFQALREHLRWFDSRPLFGKRILVTRPREQAFTALCLEQRQRFVVDATGFMDDGLLDVRGSPLPSEAKIPERFRRPTFGTLEIELTIDDPKVYTKPFTVTLTETLEADTEQVVALAPVPVRGVINVGHADAAARGRIERLEQKRGRYVGVV